MAKRPEGLQKRGNVYWLRVRVPDVLRPVIGKRELLRSLKTSDVVEARRLVRIERLKADAEFDAARRRLEAAKPPVPVTLSDSEAWHLAVSWFTKAEKAAVALPPDRDGAERHVEELQHVQRWDDASPRLSADVDELLARAGIEAVEPESRGRLARLVHAAMVEHEKRTVDRLSSGNIRFPFDHRFRELSATSEVSLQPVSPASRITLAEVVGKFDADPTRLPGSPKTVIKRAAQFRLFQEVIGATTKLADIDRQMCRALLDVLAALPSNVTTRWPGKKVKDVLVIAKAKGIAPMSAVTANSYLIAFRALMDYAVNERWIEHNPASGLLIAVDERAARSNKRQPFTVSQLNTIFRAPLYSGCVDDDYGFAKPGTARPRRGRFWMPLIALFSGMRLNEIAQLTEDDIATMDGVPVILIRSTEDGSKRVKTAAGHRFVPIHPELTRLGFLTFVESMRPGNAGGRLFPELKVARSGYVSTNASKWFARFLDSVGITDRGVNFHSFRHGFRDALREAAIPQDRVRELGGWSSRSTEDGYGKGTKASTLAAEMAKITYPGLDLEHLVPPTTGLAVADDEVGELVELT